MALTQSHFRFGIEELLELTHGWLGIEDANISQIVNTTFLLRFCVQADTTGLTNVDNEFQYNKNGAGWVKITTSSAVVKAVVSVAFANGGNCTKRLSGTGTFESTAAGCTEDGTSGGTTNDIVASGCSETECALQIVGIAVTPGDTIQFRLTRDGGILLNTYAVTPSLTVSSGNVTLTPDLIALDITTFAPTIEIAAGGTTVTPDTASLILATFAPVVAISENIIVTPDLLALVTTTYIPNIIVSNNISVSPSTLALTLAVFAPSVSIGTILIPNTLALILATYVPTILVAQNTLVTPDTLVLILTTFAPLVGISLPYDLIQNDRITILEALVNDLITPINSIESSVKTILYRIGVPTSPSISDDLDVIDVAVALSKKLAQGRRKILNNQLIFYDEDGITPLITFNLFDKDGNPTETKAYERVPVQE